MWVLLLCEDLPEAQARCKQWPTLHIGVGQAMSINRQSIEFVANYVPDRDADAKKEADLLDASKSHDPQMIFLHGLIAYSQSRSPEALELFRKSLVDGDARFLTHFARAFRDRLERELAAKQ